MNVPLVKEAGLDRVHAHMITQSDLVDKAKQVIITIQNTMIEAVDWDAVNIDICGQPTKLRTGLKDYYLVSGTSEVVADAQAKEPSADND
jgi:hypothetical protein